MKYDLILVGGGLANGLLAYRLRTTRPEMRLLLLEQSAKLGGNHTWCFHEADINVDQHRWIAPLVEHSWPGYEVRFPKLRRVLQGRYACFTGARLHDVVSKALGDSVRLNCSAETVAAESVVLDTGEVLDATAVVDGRGPLASPNLTVCFQKFLGREMELAKPHGLQRPILMDATVSQDEGYRFVYTLPLGPRRLLIEDTRYADTAAIDACELRTRIDCYADHMGWRIRAFGREEVGVLPILLGGDIEAFWSDPNPGVPRTGLRAALFHPTTGYSLPEAVRLADDLARSPPSDAGELYENIRRRSMLAWRRGSFFRGLNRMLFLAGQPEQRFRVLQRFYGLPAPLIDRFYAGSLSLSDRARLVCGKPPVPFFRGLRAFLAADSVKQAATTSEHQA